MFIINSIANTVTLFLSVFSVFFYASLPSEYYAAGGLIMTFASIILTLAFSALGYFLAIRRLERKFDVE